MYQVVHLVDKFDLWHRLPVLLGAAYLGIRRHLHQRYNLLHVGKVNGKKYDTEEFTYRTADGTCNHPVDHLVGSQGTFFGRNMLPSTSSYAVGQNAINYATLIKSCKFDSFNFTRYFSFLFSRLGVQISLLNLFQRVMLIFLDN